MLNKVYKRKIDIKEQRNDRISKIQENRLRWFEHEEQTMFVKE